MCREYAENVGSIAILKACAGESFGEAALLNDWDAITPNHTAVSNWFDRAKAGRLTDASGKLTIQYKVGDRLVCRAAWAAMRHIPAATAETIDRKLRAGETVWNDGTRRTAANATRTLEAHHAADAVTFSYVSM